MTISIITATHRRSDTLTKRCQASVASQTCAEIEWVVVNDGSDPDTREVVEATPPRVCVVYVETPHRGLIASRNLGLDQATGELIAFLDDDNVLYPGFAATMAQVFQQRPEIMMAVPVRRQRRDVYRDGQRVRTGKQFIRPLPGATDEDFVRSSPSAWFDSNGFVHRRHDGIRFNPSTLIMSDYEYLLQCFSAWGLGSLAVCGEELVDYVQSSDGIIGRSSWSDWLRDLEHIRDHRADYAILDLIDPDPWLREQIEEARARSLAGEDLPGFPRGGEQAACGASDASGDRAGALVQEDFQPAIDEALRRCRGRFGDRLEAVFIGGSVAAGEAWPGESDVDWFMFLRDEPTAEDRSWCKEAEVDLVDGHPAAKEFHLNVHATDFLEREQQLMKFIFRHNGLCLHGDGLLERLEERGVTIPEPSPGLARARIGWLKQCVEGLAAGRLPDGLFAGALPADLAELSPDDFLASRKLIRHYALLEGAHVLMLTDDFRSFRQGDVLPALGTRYPQWQGLMSMAARVLVDPLTARVPPGIAVDEVLPFARWTVQQTEGAEAGMEEMITFVHNSPLDTHAMAALLCDRDDLSLVWPVATWPFDPQQWRQALAPDQGHRSYFACAGDCRIGHAALRKSDYPGEYILSFVYVAPAYRGKEVGVSMIRFLEDVATGELGASRLRLVARSTNEKALRCYAKAGFTESSREDTAVWMTKPLQAAADAAGPEEAQP